MMIPWDDIINQLCYDTNAPGYRQLHGVANAIPTRQIFPDGVLINARIEELDNASVSEAISCTISAIVVNLLLSRAHSQWLTVDSE